MAAMNWEENELHNLYRELSNIVVSLRLIRQQSRIYMPIQDVLQDLLEELDHVVCPAIWQELEDMLDHKIRNEVKE